MLIRVITHEALETQAEAGKRTAKLRTVDANLSISTTQHEAPAAKYERDFVIAQVVTIDRCGFGAQFDAWCRQLDG